MILYKFVPTPEIAEQISEGVFRFYKLVKYIKLEQDNVGRSDKTEGAISYPDDGKPDFIKKLPTASFNGIECKYQIFNYLLSTFGNISCFA